MVSFERGRQFIPVREIIVVPALGDLILAHVEKLFRLETFDMTVTKDCIPTARMPTPNADRTALVRTTETSLVLQIQLEQEALAAKPPL
jgi:hypothetical protein